MKRSKFSLSHYRLFTGEMGKLIPVCNVEALPGDSMRIGNSALIRLSPLVSPVMHPVQVRFHTWFVPYRLLWPGWEDFITGGVDGQGGDSGAFPTITFNGEVAVGSLADYLGIPPGNYAANPLEVSALPFMAYAKIYNDFYRDQDLCPEVTDTQLNVLNCAWEKDYFSSARPWPQRGPDITLPLGDNAPVTVNNVFNSAGVQIGSLAQDAAANGAHLFTNPPGSGATLTGISIRGTADLSQASQINVNDFRLAFAMQRYQEARARYGSRFTEYLRFLGVRPSDQRLQRPEYITGGKQTISFSEVVQSYGADTQPENPLGKLGGHGISALRSRRGIKFFEEHGQVITLMSVRPKTIYADGLHRSWSRRTKEDYWQRELQHIGQQEVLNTEVYANQAQGTFGYQDRYDDYRRIPSGIAGEFRTTLNFWHLARQFSAPPALNQSFVECDPSKRIFAEQTTNPLWCMVNNNIQARRLVTSNTNSRIE